MSATKISYDGPAGRCTVLHLADGRILEVRRDGATFGGVRCSERRMWNSKAEWEASLPIGTLFSDDESSSEATIPVENNMIGNPKEEAYFFERAGRNEPALLRLDLSPKDKAFYKIVEACAMAERLRVSDALKGEDADRIRAARDAYDRASSKSVWIPAKSDAPIKLWLSWNGELLPVYVAREAGVIRFRRGNVLLTLAEVGAPRWAALWSLREDGRILRV